MGKGAVALLKDPRDKKITTGAWALFFVMWGVTFLIERVTQFELRNVQYLLAGLILVGMNGVRFALGIPMSRLTLVVGLLAAAGGILWQTQGEVQIFMMVAVTLVSLLAAEGILRVESRFRRPTVPVRVARASGDKPRHKKRAAGR